MCDNKSRTRCIANSSVRDLLSLMLLKVKKISENFIIERILSFYFIIMYW